MNSIHRICRRYAKEKEGLQQLESVCTFIGETTSASQAGADGPTSSPSFSVESLQAADLGATGEVLAHQSEVDEEYKQRRSLWAKQRGTRQVPQCSEPFPP